MTWQKIYKKHLQILKIYIHCDSSMSEATLASHKGAYTLSQPPNNGVTI